jgi:hypothetical protein
MGMLNVADIAIITSKFIDLNIIFSYTGGFKKALQV